MATENIWSKGLKMIIYSETAQLAMILTVPDFQFSVSACVLHVIWQFSSIHGASPGEDRGTEDDPYTDRRVDAIRSCGVSNYSVLYDSDVLIFSSSYLGLELVYLLACL